MTVRGIALAAALTLASVACGKKGPPLPPLINLPAAPPELTAIRRGADVALQFTVPNANSDGSKPADLSHIDIFTINGSATIPVGDVVRRGTRVGRIEINPPPDPDEENSESTQDNAAGPPDEHGKKNQGDTVNVTVPFPLEGPAPTADDVRSYVAVGYNKRGRRGNVSQRAIVSLADPPPVPGQPAATYDETGVTVSWPPTPTAVAYHVYLLGERNVRQTSQPLTDRTFVDPHVEWNTERCYAVRAIAGEGDRAIESELSPPACVTAKDTFPPKAPTGLQAIASEAAVNLIWDGNSESDLAGYIVLRAIAPSSEFVPVTPMPIEQPTFTDTVPSGAQVTYVVEAVDKAGNRSPRSDRVVETAR